MTALRFRYRDAEGHVSIREVENWIEQPDYFEGLCSREGALRTFRFDRVEEWYGETDALLGDPSRRRAPRRYPRYHDKVEISFTGFSQAERAILEARAASIGLAVRASVTQHLDYLCVGPTAGVSKKAHANAVGARLLTPDEFNELVSSGVVPSDKPAPAPTRDAESEPPMTFQSPRFSTAPKKRPVPLWAILSALAGGTFVAGMVIGASLSGSRTVTQANDTPAVATSTASVVSTPDVVAAKHVPLLSNDGRLFRLSDTAVTCDSPAVVGLARTVYPRMEGSANLTKAFDVTRCLPPIVGSPNSPPQVYQLHHLEDVNWRASLDDGVTWVGGPLRVAELRQESNGQELIFYVAADDLAPVDASSDSPAAGAATP